MIVEKYGLPVVLYSSGTVFKKKDSIEKTLGVKFKR